MITLGRRNKAIIMATREPHRFRLPCGLCDSHTCDGYCDEAPASEPTNVLPPHDDSVHSGWAG